MQFFIFLGIYSYICFLVKFKLKSRRREKTKEKHYTHADQRMHEGTPLQWDKEHLFFPPTFLCYGSSIVVVFLPVYMYVLVIVCMRVCVCGSWSSLGDAFNSRTTAHTFPETSLILHHCTGKTSCVLVKTKYKHDGAGIVKKG